MFYLLYSNLQKNKKYCEEGKKTEQNFNVSYLIGKKYIYLKK